MKQFDQDGQNVGRSLRTAPGEMPRVFEERRPHTFARSVKDLASGIQQCTVPEGWVEVFIVGPFGRKSLEESPHQLGEIGFRPEQLVSEIHGQPPLLKRNATDNPRGGLPTRRLNLS